MLPIVVHAAGSDSTSIMDLFIRYTYVIGVAIIAGGIIGYFFIVKKRRQKELKRQEDLKRASFEIGFTYNPNADIDLPDLRLFTTGYERVKKNVLTTTRSTIKWSIFDYQFQTGSGKNRTIHIQTVVMAQLGRELPEFHLSREGFFQKLGEVIGFKDIDFKDYPEFSKKYYLKGADEKTVRQVFTPHVILTITDQQLEGNMEAKGNFIVVYTPRRYVKPADLYQFFHRTRSIIDLFR